MSKSTDSRLTTSTLRLLILSDASNPTASAKAHLPIASLLTTLTGTSPSQDQLSLGFAGYTTHAPLVLKTKYYEASIGLWCDEVGPEWKDIMTDSIEEVKEVRSAIGAIVFMLRSEDTRTESLRQAFEVLEQIEEVRVLCEDEVGLRDVLGVVLLIGDDADKKVDEVEDMRTQRGIFGWDIISWNGEVMEVGPAQVSDSEHKSAVRNEYGEKIGIERLREILEAVPWTTRSPDTQEPDFLGDDLEVDWTTSEQRDLDKEMIGLKLDLHQSDNPEDPEKDFVEDEWPELQESSEDVKVERLQGLMERLIATREAASELSGPEKQNFAKREVQKIMKELG